MLTMTDKATTEVKKGVHLQDEAAKQQWANALFFSETIKILKKEVQGHMLTLDNRITHLEARVRELEEDLEEQYQEQVSQDLLNKHV